MLRIIEVNDTLRQDILALDNSTFPLYWTNATFPEDVKNSLTFRTPSYLECEAQICNIGSSCSYNPYSGGYREEFYVQSILISATNLTYSPRNLKLFCWRK